MEVIDQQSKTRALLKRDVENGIAIVTLSNPEKYNVLSTKMISALDATFYEIRQFESIRVVIIAAEGEAFCAGHDLKEMRSSENKSFHKDIFTQYSNLMLTINRMPQPVIAQVNGIATAGGCQLVAACDLAIASETARFALSSINLGLFCATPAVPISRNLSRKNALHLLLTGEFISAQQAKQYGLINEVVAAAELDIATKQLAIKISQKSPFSIALGKEMFYRQLAMDLPSAYAYASERLAYNMDSHDAREGIDSFFENRHPVWKGY